jgi:hypothetical protein
MVRVLAVNLLVSCSVSTSILMVFRGSPTVARTWGCPRVGFPCLAGLNISIGRESPGRGYRCGQAEDRREPHSEPSVVDKLLARMNDTKTG